MHPYFPDPSCFDHQCLLGMAHAFFLGVDVLSNEEGEPYGATYTVIEKEKETSDEEATYRLDRVRHHSEVTSADDLADHLQSFLAERPYIGRTSIIVNRGKDFGQSLLEALEDRGLDPIAAILTDGAGVTAGETDEMSVRMGGVSAVRTLAALYRDRSLLLEGFASETGSQLVRDVQALVERLDEADGDLEALGRSTTGPSFDPDATHITSAALAAWLGTEWSFDPSQHLKESPPTDPTSVEGPET